MASPFLPTNRVVNLKHHKFHASILYPVGLKKENTFLEDKIVLTEAPAVVCRGITPKQGPSPRKKEWAAISHRFCAIIRQSGRAIQSFVDWGLQIFSSINSDLTIPTLEGVPLTSPFSPQPAKGLSGVVVVPFSQNICQPT